MTEWLHFTSLYLLSKQDLLLLAATSIFILEDRSPLLSLGPLSLLPRLSRQASKDSRGWMEDRRCHEEEGVYRTRFGEHFCFSKKPRKFQIILSKIALTGDGQSWRSVIRNLRSGFLATESFPREEHHQIKQDCETFKKYLRSASAYQLPRWPRSDHRTVKTNSFKYLIIRLQLEQIAIFLMVLNFFLKFVILFLLNQGIPSVFLVQRGRHPYK